jgi:hypothetical protein
MYWVVLYVQHSQEKNKTIDSFHLNYSLHKKGLQNLADYIDIVAFCNFIMAIIVEVTSIADNMVAKGYFFTGSVVIVVDVVVHSHLEPYRIQGSILNIVEWLGKMSCHTTTITSWVLGAAQKITIVEDCIVVRVSTCLIVASCIKVVVVADILIILSFKVGSDSKNVGVVEELSFIGCN